MARQPIRIAAKGLEPAKRLFGRIRQFGADPVGLLEIWAGLIEASTRSRFDSGRGPGGIPWQMTKRQVDSAVGSSGPNKAKILVDKGNLESSIRNVVHVGGFEVGVDAIGESSRNAHVHQLGFDGTVQVPTHTRTINQAFGIPLPAPKDVTVRAHSRQMKMPKREFLGIDDDDKRDMKEAAIDYLRGFLGEH